MAPGGVLQRDGHEVYGRIDSAREVTTNLLVTTEDSAMTGRVGKPRSENTRMPQVNTKSLYHSLLRNSPSEKHSESSSSFHPAMASKGPGRRSA